MSNIDTYFYTLLKYYALKGDAKYIISRVINSGIQVSPSLKSLYCENCVMLFIPVHNCEMQVHENDIMIFCKKCKNKLFLKIEKRVNEYCTVKEKKSFDDIFKI